MSKESGADQQRLPPGFLPTPTPAASAMVAITVMILPAGSRDRYRDEFRAELIGLPARRQIGCAASVLGGSVALRSALRSRGIADPLDVRRHWTCRIGWHRYRLVSDDNPENRRNMHRECERCATIKDIREYSGHDGRWMTRGM